MKLLFLPLLFACAFAFAQGPPGGDWHPNDQHGPPPRQHIFGAPPGRWWHDPMLIGDLGLSTDQQKRIDDAYQANRLRLIELTGSLQKEQAVLEPMLSAEHVDESRAIAQIDRVAQARAELEKANARMLLAFRGVLSQDQWKKLQAGPGHPPGH